MAVFTTTASGNVSAGATFVGGVAPAQFGSDQIALANGHSLTFDRNTTLGNAPPSTPLLQVTASATGTGGSLPAGTYRARIVSYDGTKESTSSAPSGNVTITAGQVVRVTLPALLPAATGWNVYLTNTGGATGTERRYALNKAAGTFDCSSASWEDGTVAFGSAATLPNGHALSFSGSTGSIIINDGVKLTAKGDVSFPGDFTVNAPTADAGVEYDASGSASSGAAVYNFLHGNESQGGTPRFIGRGSATSWAYIRGKAGTTAPKLDVAVRFSATADMRLDLQWTKFSNLGNANSPAVNCKCGVAYNQLLSNVIFAADCYTLNVNGIAATGGWIISDVTLYQTAGQVFTSRQCSIALQQLNTSSDVTTGTRTCTRLVSTVLPMALNYGGSTYDSCVFANAWVTLVAGAGGSSSGKYTIQNSFARKLMPDATNGTDTIALNGDLIDSYFFIDQLTGGGTDFNPHGVGMGQRTQSVLRNTWEYAGSDGSGDMVKDPGNPGSAVVYTVKNNLFLPNQAGLATGSLTNSSTSANYTWEVEHNTWIVGPRHGIAMAEGAAGRAGQFPHIRSNLFVCVSTATTPRLALGNDQVTPLADIMTASGVTNNAGFNLQDVTGNPTAQFYSWYKQPETSAPGTGDVDLGDVAGLVVADLATNGPKLVEPTRNLAAWAASVLGATGTVSQKITAGLNALYAIADASSPNHVNGLAATDPATWVRTGFAPRNILLKNAGHDGVTIGAVEGVWAGSLLLERRKGAVAA